MTQCEPKRSCMTGRTAAIVMVTLLIFANPITVAWTAEDAPSCLSATGEAALAPCRRELLRDPGNLEIRFALSDALMGLRRYADAVAVLQQGLENFPGDDTIKKKLILAESYLDEQQYIEKQKKSAAAASRSKKQDTQIRLSIIRCEKLRGDAAMAACNDGLAVIPGHPELLTGRGNVWLEMDRFGNAIRDYEAALAAGPKNRMATKNLRLAQTKREVKVAQCLQAGGPDGLKACDAALMKGASDEFAVQKQRAGLLQAMGREKEAIEAYRVAKPEPPVPSPPAKTFDSPAVKKPVPAPPKASPPIEMAAMQPRQYSNAPEVPGITH